MNDKTTQLLDEYRSAVREVWWDNSYWEEIATGQDTEEAEESGRLHGYMEGLGFAYELLTGSRPFVPSSFMEKAEREGRDNARESIS